MQNINNNAVGVIGIGAQSSTTPRYTALSGSTTRKHAYDRNNNNIHLDENLQLNEEGNMRQTGMPDIQEERKEEEQPKL